MNKIVKKQNFLLENELIINVTKSSNYSLGDINVIHNNLKYF